MFTNDQRQLLRTFTFRRAGNALLTLMSFYFSRMFKSPVHWGMPVSMSLEPTTACNLGCPECPSGLKQFDRPTGNVREDDYTSWIAQAASHAMYMNFYFQGEPFIHPRLLDMVRVAKQHRIYTSTSTNAHFISQKTAEDIVASGLDRLIISIDGTTQEVYSQYRVFGDLEKVLEGTRRVVEAKRAKQSATPHIIFQFLVVRPNEHQTDAVLRLADELNVDEVRFKTAQVYHFENGHPLIPQNEKYSRYKRMSDGTYRIKNALDNHCWRMWSSCVVTWDGRVVPCCFDKDAKHAMGDLRAEPLRNVWNNAAYQHFRSLIFRSRASIDICANCSEGTRVWTEA